MALKNSRLTSPVPVDATASFSNESTAGVPATALICSRRVLVDRLAVGTTASEVASAVEGEVVVVARKLGRKEEGERRLEEGRVKAVACKEERRRRRKEGKRWC